jgi:nucleotide-binding universal stress UspA family protein
VCVGVVGLHHVQNGRLGSTAAATAVEAHCPVAIIRRNRGRAPGDAGCVVVVADECPDNGVVLEAAMEEARLRNAPLRVITCWRARFSDVDDRAVPGDGGRRLRADLDRRLARWTARYRNLEVEPVVLHGTVLDYLAKNADTVQLVIVGSRGRCHLRELIGPAGNAALAHGDCSVLVVDRQHL